MKSCPASLVTGEIEIKSTTRDHYLLEWNGYKTDDNRVQSHWNPPRLLMGV